jgi:ABC-type sugar transport system ATPase subunit
MATSVSLGDHLDRRPGEPWGNSCASLRSPAVFLFDEPPSGLDARIGIKCVG